VGRPGAGWVWAPGTGVPAPPAGRVPSRLGAARRRLGVGTRPRLGVSTWYRSTGTG